MALTRPTLLPVPAFDATKEFVFTFNIQGASEQIVANKLVIRNQDTNDIVYEEKQETFKYEHILNANELQNNVYYNAVLTVFDASDNESPASIPIQFWCYSTPTISFTNLPPNNLVTNASYNFEFTYLQAENEPLNSYSVNLYNSFKTLISTSGVIYAVDGTPPFSANYLFTGFEDSTIYYVEVTGVTINNTEIATEQVQINVEYEHPDIFSLVELQNNCDEGYISVKSNLVLIEGESNPDPPIYIDNKEVDLTNPEHWVEWNKGYSITGNMLARFWFRNPNEYSTLAKFSNVSGQTITMNYMLGYENIDSQDLQSYVEIYVKSIEGMEYYIFSNYIDTLSDTEYYNVWLTRENDIYELKISAV